MNDDQLIGYLLKALEPTEMLEAELQIQSSPSLRSRLEQLEAMLEPLAELAEAEADVEDFLPPTDLVSRTLQTVAVTREQEATANESASRRSLVGYSEATPTSDRHRASWWDVAFSCCAAAALIAMLFPALYQTREHSRTAICADQLRQLGQKLTRYATTASDQRLPNLEATGREAFAGVYAVRLKGAGLLEDDGLVWCPAEPIGGMIPDPTDLAKADAASLSRWQHQAGGRYAYNLGVIEADRFQAPKFGHRSKFALMSDVVYKDHLPPHPGVINLLYEDGHVERRGMHALDLVADHPFVNRASRKEAGLDVDDAVLGPSATPPFVWVDQSGR